MIYEKKYNIKDTFLCVYKAAVASKKVLTWSSKNIPKIPKKNPKNLTNITSDQALC